MCGLQKPLNNVIKKIEGLCWHDPKLDEIVNGKRGILQGIQACMDSKCLVSAVILMFSAVDTLAALTRPAGDQSTNGDVFKKWATVYLKPESNLGCSSIDLWGARCGVLHLYSPDSDLSFHGKAKRIYYQWTAGPTTGTARSIPSGSIVINVEQLHKAVEGGIHEFIQVVDKDGGLRDQVHGHLASLLCYEPFPTEAV